MRSARVVYASILRQSESIYQETPPICYAQFTLLPTAPCRFVFQCRTLPNDFGRVDSGWISLLLLGSSLETLADKMADVKKAGLDSLKTLENMSLGPLQFAYVFPILLNETKTAGKWQA